MSILNNAHDFSINNLHLNTHTGNNNVINHITQVQSVPGDPVAILHNARAVEATHTSNIASHAPKCHPKTRVKVIADMVDWVTGAHDDERPKLMLWFPGPAGAGKTCIMRAVVDRCEEAGLLTASYFFSTRVPNLRHERPFVATIAHQLSIDPILGPLIHEAIRNRPAIFYESLDLQMKKLVLEPLNSCPRTVFIAVDGFDECSKVAERKHLLRLLHTLVQSLPTVIVVIASRPELDIRSTFNKREFKAITHVLRLEDYDGMDDTRVFICDEFENIRETHPLRGYIPVGWPLEEGVGILHERSSGHFIFPATAMKYIANPRRNPVDSLEEILALSSNASSSSGASSKNPLAELDSLYSLILHPPETDWALMTRLLHCIIGMVAVDSSSFLSPSFLDEFLRLPPGTTGITLCDLHSILSIPEENDKPIRFHHKSLEDYLLSRDRSLDMFQEPSDTYLDLTLSCVHHLQAWASSPYSSASVGYAAKHWNCHISHFLMNNRTSSHPLPNAILHFDPRIIWRFLFVDGSHLRLPFDLSTKDDTHRQLCAGGPCFQLCKILRWMEKCKDKTPRLLLLFSGDDWDARVGALPKFDIESGLYDPDARFPNRSSQSKSATFPGLGAWPAFPSSLEGPLTEATLSAVQLSRPSGLDEANTPSESRPQDPVLSSLTPTRPAPKRSMVARLKGWFRKRRSR